MLVEYPVTITVDALGDGIGYAGSRIRGKVVAIKYEYGSLEATVDATITGETTGVPIMTKEDLAQANAWFYPRAIPVKVTDGAAFTDAAVDIWVFDERIKVVLAQGGNATSGKFTFYVDEPQVG